LSVRVLAIPVVLVLVLAQGLGAAPSRAASSTIASVTVKGGRLHVGDLVAGLTEDAASVDLGPTPSSTGTRVVTREDISRALRDRGVDVPGTLPEAIRVRRQLRSLDAAELTRMVTDGLAEKLTRGASLQGVRPARTVSVPDGWTEVRYELPRPPHRTGALVSAVTLSFFEGSHPLWTLVVPVDLMLAQDATLFDVPRGSHVTFVIRRGLVEVSSSGTVTVDADIGGVAPVTVMPSGRSIPARLEDASTAVMVDVP
jgi:hypothetical protein